MNEAEATTDRRDLGPGRGERPAVEQKWRPTDELAAASVEPLAVTARPGALAVKRAIDLAGALIVMIALSPFWLLIALTIKLDSPGPVLFRQPRVGRGGRAFAMFKFRTMVRDADARKLEVLHLNDASDGLFKIARDPRVTRFGRFLRTTSLDEVPQVINVLLGTMSLVGPRPLVPEEDALIEGVSRMRLSMRPGITGVWQVAGASRIPIGNMVGLDLDYIRRWSIWGDIRLMAGTLRHMVGGRGV